MALWLFGSLPVKQSRIESSRAQKVIGLALWCYASLFLPLCHVASSFNNLTRLHRSYVLLPAPVLVLCSIPQKPGTKEPANLQDVYRAHPACKPR